MIVGGVVTEGGVVRCCRGSLVATDDIGSGSSIDKISFSLHSHFHNAFQKEDHGIAQVEDT